MVWLKSNDRFHEVVEFDPESGRWRQVTQSSNDDGTPLHTNGFYSFLSDVFCAIFRSGDQLLVQIGVKQIELTPDVKIVVSGPPKFRQFSLAIGGLPVVSLTYDSQWNPLEFDPTTCIEEEDFDFGLFLSNIAKDPQRQARLKEIL
jgi:hypothetical protein